MRDSRHTSGEKNVRAARVALGALGALVALALLGAPGSSVKADPAPDTPNATDAQVAPLAEVEQTHIDGGPIEGSNLTWEVTEDDAGNRTLTISGEGPMPDYTNTSLPPYRSYYQDYSRKPHVVIGDDVTRVGSYAFAANGHISSLHIGKGVKAIGDHAFQSTRIYTDLTIPGNVETVEEWAFAAAHWDGKLTLEEGVKKLGSQAFAEQRLDKSGEDMVIRLPASLEEVGIQTFLCVSAYEVAEGNPSYKTVDGVLYSKDGTQLVDYPNYKSDLSEFTVPQDVTTVLQSAFKNLQYLKKVVIPSGVKTMAYDAFRGAESLQVVEIADGVTINGNNLSLTFYGTPSLQEVRLPEDQPLVFSRPFARSSSLRELTIPKGTSKIDQFFAIDQTNTFPALETLTYDAANAEISSDLLIGDSQPPFELVIGRNVDVLPANFDLIGRHRSSISFEHSNKIYIEPGALASSEEPLASLSGTVWVDEQGVLYSYDATAGTATLVNIPAGVLEVTIPETITPTGDGTCTVTAVATGVAKHADNLQSLTFEKPGLITSLAPYAFANCPSLESVNGEDTADGAKALFTGVDMSTVTNPFYNTGLGGAASVDGFAEEMHGLQSLTVAKEGSDPMSVKISSSGNTAEWKTGEGASTGGYHLLTGDVLTIEANTQNAIGSGNARYRIYLRFDGEDAVPSLSPGKTINVEDEEGNPTASGRVYATEDPYVIYLEFSTYAGATATVPLTVNYPSPTSTGGGLTVWGVAGAEKTDENAEKGELVEPEGDSIIQAYWSTKRDPFTLSKTNNNADGTVSIGGTGNESVGLTADLKWTISLKRAESVVSDYGKDYVRSIEYVDTPALPQGVAWSDELIKAIADGRVMQSGDNLIVDGETVASIKGTGITGRSISYDKETGQLALSWRFVNGSIHAEAAPPDVTLTIMPAALDVDLNSFSSANDGHLLTNTVKATLHYTHSADNSLNVSAPVTLQTTEPRLLLTKKAGDVTYFGEDLTYDLTLTNTGSGVYTADEEGSYTLRDELPEDLYITPEHLEEMFREAPEGTSLTVTIENASLGTWEEVTATSSDGSKAWKTPGNSSDVATKTGTELTITYDGNNFTVNAGDQSATKDSLAETLRAIGYAPTYDACYTCTWTLNNSTSKFTFAGGSTLHFSIPATVKTSFELLGTDRPGEYPDNTRVVSNTAKLYDQAGTVQANGSAPDKTVRREAVLGKDVARKGITLGDGAVFSDGDLLDYTITFTHYGTGAYDNLPLIDDLYGSQYLLVPADMNPELKSNEGARETTIGGETYYALTEGKYGDVVVGLDDGGSYYTADSIVVTSSSGTVELPGESEGTTEQREYSGLHTKISWYWDSLPGEEYAIELTYQALVSSDATESAGTALTVGNMVWANDLPSKRLWAGLWGGGSLVNFKKSIVDTLGNSPENDMLLEDDHSSVGPGDEVTYRIALKNPGTSHITLSADDIRDELPETYGVFSWEKEKNVKLKLVKDGTVTINCLDNWDITSAEEEGHYFLEWSESFSATFDGKGSAYLYVTLTFPGNEGDETWDRYTAAAGSEQPRNTLWVSGFPSTVTHDLEQPGNAFIQKGVHSRLTGPYGSDTNPTSTLQPGRLSYDNMDTQSRFVQYYAIVMNAGNTRLYLNDLYDQLPEGFAFRSLRSKPSATQNARVITTIGGSVDEEPFGDDPFVDLDNFSVLEKSEMSFVSARVSAVTEGENLRFKIEAGAGEHAVKYDETRGLYYLDRGEAIVFGYVCQVGLYDDTEDVATNALAMPYENYLGIDPVVTAEGGPDVGLRVRGTSIEGSSEYNDGNRLLLDSEDIEERYGFGSDETSELWLVSEVTQKRLPRPIGIRKSVVSSRLEGESTNQDYTGSVSPYATVTWKTTVSNRGESQIANYVVEDTMEAPYSFVGNVTFASYQEGGATAMAEKTLFSIGPHDPDAETVTLTVPLTTQSYTVKVNNPEWTSVGYDNSLFVKYSRNKESGEETLALRFLGTVNPANNANRWMLGGGGYAEISYSTSNSSTEGSISSRPYLNEATFLPEGCSISEVLPGSAVTGDGGSVIGATTTCPVNVSFGYATSSDKRVTEQGATDNTASALGEKNDILLGSAKSAFTYELEVTNQSGQALSSMTLIDNLPEPKDGSPFDPDAARNSAFTVAFANEPQVSITIKDGNGEPVALDESDYEVTYAAKTEFSDEDWAGENAADWEAAPAGARSLRVVIRDANGSEDLIPAKATVTVSFAAQVEGAADPGTVAWNSFGYRYQVRQAAGSPLELSAVSLPVGVRVPTVPTLVKRVVNGSGEAATIDEGASFSLVVYEGAPLTGTFSTAEEVEKALAEAGRKIAVLPVTVEVERGASQSEPVRLTGAGWTWEQGKTYSVTELAPEEPFVYESINSDTSAHFSFTYDPAVQATLECVNEYALWDLTVAKVDGDDEGTPLPGAVFALYSPDGRDGADLEDILEQHPEYQGLDVKETVTPSGESATYHLVGIEETGEGGTLTWPDLKRERYYVLELQAPEDYVLPDNPGRVITRSAAAGGAYTLSVPNHRRFVLPDTGGPGAGVPWVAGAVLAGTACAALLARRRRARP